MSTTLRGFVYRVIAPGWPMLWPASPWTAETPWMADIGEGSWNDPDWEDVALADLGRYATQQEALDAACAWLAENATTKAYEVDEARARVRTPGGALGSRWMA